MGELPSHYSSRAEMDAILMGLLKAPVLRVNEIATAADRMPFLQDIDREEALQGINSITAANEILPDVDELLAGAFVDAERIPKGLTDPNDRALQIGEKIAGLDTPQEQDETLLPVLEAYMDTARLSERYSRLFGTDRNTFVIATTQLGVQLAYPVMCERKMKQIAIPWFVLPVYLATLQGLGVGGRTAARLVVYAEQVDGSVFEDVKPLIKLDEKGLQDAWFSRLTEGYKVSGIMDIRGSEWDGKYFQTS